MVYIYLAEGFEEVEALTAVDVLRRASVEVRTVSVTGDRTVTGTHGIPVTADLLMEDTDHENCEMMVLPGGMPGAANLQDHEGIIRHVRCFAENGRYLAAICAAPMIFGGCGILKGRKATVYPGMEDTIADAEATGRGVEKDGNLITGKGPAYAAEFALKIVETLKGKSAADEVAADMLYTAE